MQDFRNIELSNNLTLEPRLQEYWKKINYYKNNNIAPSSNLEKEFSITDEDRIKLKMFIGKNIQLPTSQEAYNVPDNSGFQIKYEDYKKDPRYERLQQKLQRDKDANSSKYSYGKGPVTSGYKNSMNSTSENTDEQYFKEEDKNHFLDTRQPYNSDYALNVRHKGHRVYDSAPPKIQYNQYLPYKQHGDSRDLPHDNNLDCIIDKLATFRTNTNIIGQYPKEMDHEVKINRPNKNNLNVYDTEITKSYQAVPLRGKGVNAIGGTRDVDSENCLIKGLPERNAKFKSLGYPNYSDHSFQFISEDIQDPEHVVLPFPRGGAPSRLENNYRRAKPYKRDVY
jgi:hypothetical protein